MASKIAKLFSPWHEKNHERKHRVETGFNFTQAITNCWRNLAFGNESCQDSQTKKKILITWTSVTIGWWYRNRPPSKARGPSWHAFWKRQPLAEENAAKLSTNIQTRTTTCLKLTQEPQAPSDEAVFVLQPEISGHDVQHPTPPCYRWDRLQLAST